MKIGVVFPQTEFGNDIGALRDYTQTVEALGYTHILTYEHVLGANPERPGGWKGPYTYRDPFYDPFVMYSHMAAITERLEFATGILILPQRETAVVAKQAATLDVLSNGRLRLGVGTGWNKVEYIGLNQNFHTRGKRLEEQVALLRKLWTEPLITFEGKWHTIPDAGLNPFPVQRPIPIWFGGYVDAVLRRIARIGDGWMPGYAKAEQAKPDLDKLAAYCEENGRYFSDIGIEPRVHLRQGTPAQLQKTLQEWQDVGATHASFNTMGAGLDTPTKHIEAVRAFAKSVL